MLTISNYFSTNFSVYFPEAKSTKAYHTYIFDAVTNTPYAAWQKVKDLFNNKTAFIDQKINEITQENDPVRQRELFMVALASIDFHILRPKLMTFFQGLGLVEQDQYLRSTVLEGVKTQKNDLITKALHLLNEADLKNLIVSKKGLNPDFDFTKLVKNHIKLFDINANFQPYDANLAFIKSEIKSIVPQIFNFLLSIVDTLMMSTQLFDIGQAPKSAWDAAYQLDVYYRIIAIPATILWTINAYFPNPVVTGAAFVLTLLFLVGFVYSYVKWLKPSPCQLPKSINLTEKAQKGEIIPVVGRGSEITGLKNQLIKNLNASDREHPLIIGESGVGKTTIIEGLTLEILKGNIPELKNAKVFMTNAAKLTTKDMITGKSLLDQIRKTIGMHKKKIILCIDEIHSLMEDAGLRTELLSLLDSSSDSLPLFIGLTSTDQYLKDFALFNEPATKNRLKRKIEIHGTDESHTVTILKSMLHHFYPEVSDISGDLCKRIFQLNQKSDELEPKKSKSALTTLAENIRNGLKGGHLDDELEKLQTELNEKQSEEVGPIDYDRLLNNNLDPLDQLEVEIAAKKIKIQDWNKNVEVYKALKNARRDREVVIKKIADKIIASDANSPATKNLMHQFLFEQYYLLPAMNEELNLFANEKDLQVTITEKMITDLLGFGYQSMLGTGETKNRKEKLDEERKAWNKAQFEPEKKLFFEDQGFSSL